MRRPLLLLVAPLLAAGGLASAPSQASELPPMDDVIRTEWTGEPTMVSGTARYDEGEWIYTDYVYDDYGADTVPSGQPNVVSLAPTEGDFRYPEGENFAGNAADIVEVRVQTHRRRGLSVQVRLQTLVDPAVVALWVQVGEDEPIVVTADDAYVDAYRNTIHFVLPGAAAAGAVSLNIGAGLHDGSGGLRAGVPGTHDLSPGEVTTGAPSDNRLFDLAFNTEQLEGRGGAWNETAQSDALAAGDVSAFAQRIVISELRDSSNRRQAPLEPGYHVRLFRSRMKLVEGIGEEFPQYRGEYQPYALWVPESYEPDAPTPLLLSLHSLSVHHNQFRGGSSPTYTSYYEQLGDRLGALVVTPLGRGPDGWYLDEAFVDTLEVWNDVAHRYTLDPERTRITGYSMGGYGTYRFTTLMPDSFASAASVVGPPTDGIWAYPLPADGPTFTYDQLENTRSIPFWITHGVLDELVPVLGVRQQAARFGELGHEYRFALHPGEDHLSFAAKDEWSREGAWLEAHDRRVRRPHRVTLDVRPASVLSELSRNYGWLVGRLLDRIGARVDGSYWVDDVVPVGDHDVTAEVDLSSDAIARRPVGATAIQEPGTDGPSPYVLTGNEIEWGTEPTADVLRGHLAHVRSLTIDLARAGLSRHPELDITTTDPVRLTLVRGARYERTVRIEPRAG